MHSSLIDGNDCFVLIDRRKLGTSHPYHRRSPTHPFLIVDKESGEVATFRSLDLAKNRFEHLSRRCVRTFNGPARSKPLRRKPARRRGRK